MAALTDLTLVEAKEGLLKKQFSAEELTRETLAAIEKAKHLNAYIVDTSEIALSQARAADARIKKGEARLLDGIPIAVKDLFCTKGVRTTSCSKILHNFVPEYESTVTSNLFGAGAVMVGKTNMDEFAMGSANITSHWGNVINPWKRKGSGAQLVPGGSSGGSSAAVAARLAQGALGSDTGGSIRQPASFTGLAGIKPTYGRCSRYGMIAFASSLDQAGTFARTVKDSALILQAIAGYDAKDSTSYDAPVPDWSGLLKADVKGKKIGIPQEYVVDGMNAEVKALWDQGAAWLKDAGAEIVPVSLPHTQHALATYYVIAPAEASSNLSRYDGMRYGLRVTEGVKSLDEMYAKTRGQGFGAEVKRRILIGTYVLSAGYYDAYYKKAQRVRALIARDFAEVFTKVDALLTPTAPTAAFAIGEKMEDPVTMYLNDVFTVPASLAGVPAMSIPAGLSSEGLPLGLQVIGNLFDEQTVLDVSAALELAANFTARP